MIHFARRILGVGILFAGLMGCGGARAASSGGLDPADQGFIVVSDSATTEPTSRTAEPSGAVPAPRPAPPSRPITPDPRFLPPRESPFLPGEMELRGTWDFIVLFRGEPFSGTVTLPASAKGTKGTLVLPGQFDGDVTVTEVDPQAGTLSLAFETRRGAATFKGRFESSSTMAGLLEQVMVGVPRTSVPMRRLDETAIFSATRR